MKRTAMMEEEDRKKSAVLHRTLSYPSGLMADLSELEKEAQAADQQEKAQGLAEVCAQNAKAIRAQGAYMLQKALEALISNTVGKGEHSREQGGRSGGGRR